MDANTLARHPKKFKQTLCARKLIVTVFCDRKGVLMVEFMQQGTTIASEVYYETLKKLLRPIQKKRRVKLLPDNAPPQTAACTQALLEHFSWELFDHPPYTDLTGGSLL
jgi:hypothetical protein